MLKGSFAVFTAFFTVFMMAAFGTQLWAMPSVGSAPNSSLAMDSALSAKKELIKPDPQLTYGDTCTKDNPDFAGYRSNEHYPYCNRNVSYGLKTRIYAEYHIPQKCRQEYTIDHFIPLSMGGSNAPQNLWPEHKNVKATRQNLEQDLFNEIMEGRISQSEAIKEIVEAKENPEEPVPWTCGLELVHQPAPQ
jgi:hypothetical protein